MTTFRALPFFLIVISTLSWAKPILGTYEQVAVEGAAGTLRGGPVTITSDSLDTHKIWVEGLLASGKFFAQLLVETEDGGLYIVPPQHVGNFSLKRGSVSYSPEDKEVTIILNDEATVAGQVSINPEEIRAGEVQVRADGSISIPGVEISKEAIAVNPEEAAGSPSQFIFYIGKKKATQD